VGGTVVIPGRGYWGTDFDVNDGGFGRDFVRGAQEGATLRHFRSDAVANREVSRADTALKNLMAVTQSLQTLANAASPPWKRRVTGEKRGALYTLKEVARMLAANKQVANAKAIQGQAKASGKAVAVAVDQARRTNQYVTTRQFQRAGTLGGVASAGNELITIYTDLYYKQKAIRERREHILAVGRRGAAATRPLQSPVTNRTGAAATRPRISTATNARTATASTARTASAGRVGTSNTAATAGRTGNTTQTGTKRAVSRDTRTVVSTKLPTQTKTATKTATQKALESWTKTALSTLSMTGLKTLLQPRVMASVRQGARTLVNPSSALLPSLKVPTAQTSALQLGQSLIPQLMQGKKVATQSCKCPTPKKKEKSTAERCSNPVVSRTEKDGFIITKRKLLCQPSQPKFL
jgi:hypothetical protein